MVLRLSSLNRSKLFATHLPSNFRLYDKDHPLLDYLTEHKLCDIFISAREVYRLIKSLDSTKATKISVGVLKKLVLELFPILAKIFNHCLKKKCFSRLWKLSSVLPVQECRLTLTLVLVAISPHQPP